MSTAFAFGRDRAIATSRQTSQIRRMFIVRSISNCSCSDPIQRRRVFRSLWETPPGAYVSKIIRSVRAIRSLSGSRSMPMARSRPSAVSADLDYDRLSGGRWRTRLGGPFRSAPICSPMTSPPKPGQAAREASSSSAPVRKADP